MSTTAVLLDYDGTLVDSVVEVYRGTMNVLEMSGVPQLSFSAFCEEYEAPYQVFYEKLGVQASKDDILKWYFDVARFNEQPFFKDVAEVLSAMYVQGTVLGVISAHYKDEICSRLEQEGFAHYFRRVVGRAHSKVAHIQDFCKVHGVDPKCTYYVGDFASDMRDARLAGVVSVGITHGNPTRDMLIRNGAVHCIDELHELLQLLEREVCHE